ncbi:MAG: hypothetical protein PHD42_02610 [Dysgonamonadaceae bacterium]|nr:hypothetical protein [Dysgonamonadaceae bacterium]
MRKVLAVLLFGLTSLFGCYSDFDCSMGERCVKKSFQSNGVCMEEVDEFGMKQYELPDPDSIGPNMDMDGQCSFDMDCPIGFRCDNKYKVCIKR